MAWVLVLLAALVLVVAPVVRRVRRGPQIRVRARASRVVAASREVCSDYVRDLRNLGDYEQKVTRCRLDARRADGTTYSCRGWYFGLPWRATFESFHAPDGGFWSLSQGSPGVVNGGFVLVSVDPRHTRVTHWEDFRFPWWTPLLWALRPLVEAWLQRGVEVEVGLVGDAIEYLDRHGYDEPVLPPHRSASLRATRYSMATFLREQLARARPGQQS